jgi:hypothetical protein
MEHVTKVEQKWTTIGNDKMELLNVYIRNHQWASWGIGAILNINMVPEFES